MNIGIILQSGGAEEAWNAFRFSNRALDHGHDVKIFLIGPGVNCGQYTEEPFNIPELIRYFLESEGEFWACGKCMKMREMEPGDYSPLGNLENMLGILEWADKVLTF